jgi:uncharacterized protein (UPF0147 family)
MARPRGSNRNYQVAKKTVDRMLDLEEWVVDDLEKAYQVLHLILHDETIPNNQIKRGAAETIINLHNKFYGVRKGQAELTVEELEAQDIKDNEPILSLVMTN